MNCLRLRANEGTLRRIGSNRRHDSVDDGRLRTFGRQPCVRKRAAQLCQLMKTLAAIGTCVEMPTDFSFFVGRQATGCCQADRLDPRFAGGTEIIHDSLSRGSLHGVKRFTARFISRSFSSP